MLEIISSLMANFWSIFSAPTPWGDFTFADLYVGLLLVSLAFNVLILFLGIGFKNSKHGEPHNPKISKERMDDQK